MAAKSSPDNAKIIGDLHEACGGNPGDEICMDLHNNKIGRQIGTKWWDDPETLGKKKNIPPDIARACLDACVAALKSGTLKEKPFGNCAAPP